MPIVDIKYRLDRRFDVSLNGISRLSNVPSPAALARQIICKLVAPRDLYLRIINGIVTNDSLIAREDMTTYLNIADCWSTKKVFSKPIFFGGLEINWGVNCSVILLRLTNCIINEKAFKIAIPARPIEEKIKGPKTAPKVGPTLFEKTKFF